MCCKNNCICVLHAALTWFRKVKETFLANLRGKISGHNTVSPPHPQQYHSSSGHFLLYINSTPPPLRTLRPMCAHLLERQSSSRSHPCSERAGQGYLSIIVGSLVFLFGFDSLAHSLLVRSGVFGDFLPLLAFPTWILDMDMDSIHNTMYEMYWE